MPFATPYDNASRCTDGPEPGALALMRYVLDTTKGAKNLGIYNCRSVRGGSTTSVHSEGRALDIGMPMLDGRGSPAGQALVDRLSRVGSKLGIQAIIYNRKIRSAKSPRGRAYNGVNPHYDHLHVELTDEAGERLTLATIRSVMAGSLVTPAPSPDKPNLGPVPHFVNGDRILRKWMSGTDVGFVQRWVGAPDDGHFGPKTHERVKRYQGIVNLPQDGVVGPFTWAAMGVKKK